MGSIDISRNGDQVFDFTLAWYEMSDNMAAAARGCTGTRESRHEERQHDVNSKGGEGGYWQRDAR